MIVLTVVGLPAPQGSKSVINGRVVEGKSAAQRANLAAWRDAVRAECRRWLEEHPQPPIDEPVSLTLRFRFPPVASDPYRLRHATLPDVDKCTRATFDALVQGGLLKDDSRVWEARVRKMYAQEGESVGCDILLQPEGWREAHSRRVLKRRAAEARKAARAAS